MTETTKTSIFLALAVVFIGLAAIARPVVPEIKMDKMVGTNLFPDFTSPLDVKKLEIVKFDAGGEREEFRIAEVDGVWSVPSHDNYPADAKDQMGKVAEGLFDLTVVSVAAGMDEGVDATTLHSMYGVIDPDSEDANLNEGVGLKVSLTGDGDKPLVNVIVGRAVDVGDKQDSPYGDESGKLHYVRIPNQSPVYVVDIDPARFSTKFDQWIEKNLLDISTMDVRQIYVDEYSIQTEVIMTQRGPKPRASLNLIGDLTFSHDGAKTGAEKWALERMMSFKGMRLDRYEEEKLKPDQELNVEVLDGMISALNDLKIVSVTKKPAALAAALREGKSFQELGAKEEMLEALAKGGFMLYPLEDPRSASKGKVFRLLSNEGDIQLRMKDGIRYNLRFGDLTGTESEIEGDKPAESPAAAPAMGVNRYLFITADFDAAMIRPAEIQPVPAVPTEGPTEGDEKADKDSGEKLKAEKERIEKSNQREKDRYERELEDGRKRAEKLSDRFADWYYVISEDVYKKIHLTRTNVFRTKQAAPAHGEEGHVCDDDCEPTEAKPVESKLPDLPGTGGMIPMAEPKKDEPKKEDKPAEEPKKDEKPAEEPVKEEAKKDEKPTEESKKDEKPSAEPAKEEPKKDEKPAKEEPKQEEKPAEESKKEEKPFDPFGGANPSK